MYLSTALSSFSPVVLVVPSLLLIVGLVLMVGELCRIRTIKTRLRVREQELAALQREHQAQPAVLFTAEGKPSHLSQVPTQGILSMLQLAHELRSPLASIQTALDMILQGYAKSDAQLQDEMLNLARDRAVVMLGQVNAFLSLGAGQHSEIGGKAEPVQVLDVLDRLIPEKLVRAQSKAIDLATEVPDSLSMVNAAPEALDHLLSNLIDNAIKYTNPGGRVTIYLREDKRNVIGIVEDTGIGIAREDLSKVFDGFYRTDEAKHLDVDGTGLGLSIAKQVVDRYGGYLDVKSELGQGSRFRFVFPKVEPGRGCSRSQRTGGVGKEVRLLRSLQKEGIAQGLCG